MKVEIQSIFIWWIIYFIYWIFDIFFLQMLLVQSKNCWWAYRVCINIKYCVLMCFAFHIFKVLHSFYRGLGVATKKKNLEHVAGESFTLVHRRQLTWTVNLKCIVYYLITCAHITRRTLSVVLRWYYYLLLICGRRSSGIVCLEILISDNR